MYLVEDGFFFEISTKPSPASSRMRGCAGAEARLMPMSSEIIILPNRTQNIPGQRDLFAEKDNN
ncbi:unnamed protein product, partial [Musa acuminata var. zebrina]